MLKIKDGRGLKTLREMQKLRRLGQEPPNPLVKTGIVGNHHLRGSNAVGKNVNDGVQRSLKRFEK